MEWTVYILKCSNGKYYTGCTSDLQKRIGAHLAGRVHYTCDKLPLELVVTISFKDRYKAFYFEKYLKSGSGKAFSKRHFY